MGPPSNVQATDTTGSSGGNEVQTITLNNSPTGGTFRLTFGSEQTAAIAYNASSGTVDAALEALSGIDTVTICTTEVLRARPGDLPFCALLALLGLIEFSANSP